MKKKLLAGLLAAAMVFSLAACGGSGEGGSDDGAEGKEASEVKVGIVTDVGGVNDGSFNQSAWEGVSRAADELGIETKYLESATDADYIPNIETFVDEEYDLIICVGFMLADALQEEAKANPDINFALVDSTVTEELDNVACLLFEQSQASYLAGYVAGVTTESNKIGFVLGQSNDIMNEFGFGYCAGALDANPDVEILQQNVNSFSDTAGGKTAANSMIADGADVIFHAAGATGLGVIDACKEAKIWAIGVDSDQSVIAPETILTSAMKRVDNACYDEAKAVVDGAFKSGIKTYTLAEEGVDIAPTTDNLSEEVLAKVNELKESIINGDIEVPKTKDDFEGKYGAGIYKLAE